jgi:glycerophosphoryl diester phosphodiesterase
MTSQRSPLVVAHRGYSGIAPENTMAAFSAAVNKGVAWIECDIRRTKDGEFVVLHDASLQRTTNGSGYLRNIRWTEVKEFDAGSWFARKYNAERIPTLDLLLSKIPPEINLNLEIKPPPLRGSRKEEFLASFVEVISPTLSTRNILVSSFSLNALKTLRRISPLLPLGVLTHGNILLKPTIRLLHELKAEWFVHNIRTLRPSIVHAIQNEGFRVAAFTVNSMKQAEHAEKCGVDFVITNELEVMQSYFGQAIEAN